MNRRGLLGGLLASIAACFGWGAALAAPTYPKWKRVYEPSPDGRWKRIEWEQMREGGHYIIVELTDEPGSVLHIDEWYIGEVYHQWNPPGVAIKAMRRLLPATDDDVPFSWLGNRKGIGP